MGDTPQFPPERLAAPCTETREVLLAFFTCPHCQERQSVDCGFDSMTRSFPVDCPDCGKPVTVME